MLHVRNSHFEYKFQSILSIATNVVLDQLAIISKIMYQGAYKQLLGFVVCHKLSFFGHTIRDGGCELVKCVIQGKVSGKGRPKTLYSSNITNG